MKNKEKLNQNYEKFGEKKMEIYKPKLLAIDIENCTIKVETEQTNSHASKIDTLRTTKDHMKLFARVTIGEYVFVRRTTIGKNTFYKMASRKQVMDERPSDVNYAVDIQVLTDEEKFEDETPDENNSKKAIESPDE